MLPLSWSKKQTQSKPICPDVFYRDTLPASQPALRSFSEGGAIEGKTCL